MLKSFADFLMTVLLRSDKAFCQKRSRHNDTKRVLAQSEFIIQTQITYMYLRGGIKEFRGFKLGLFIDIDLELGNFASDVSCVVTI